MTFQYSVSHAPEAGRWVIKLNDDAPIDLVDSEEQALEIALLLCNNHPQGLGRVQRLSNGKVIVTPKRSTW